MEVEGTLNVDHENAADPAAATLPGDQRGFASTLPPPPPSPGAAELPPPSMPVIPAAPAVPGSVVPPELVAMAPPVQHRAAEDAYHEALQRIEKQHRDELDTLREAHRAALHDLEEANAAEARFLEEAHQRELDRVRKSLAELEDARRRLQNEIDLVRLTVLAVASQLDEIAKRPIG